MEKNIFETLLITTFYIRYKEEAVERQTFCKTIQKSGKRCLQARRIPSC